MVGWGTLEDGFGCRPGRRHGRRRRRSGAIFAQGADIRPIRSPNYRRNAALFPDCGMDSGAISFKKCGVRRIRASYRDGAAVARAERSISRIKAGRRGRIDRFRLDRPLPAHLP